MSARVRRKLPMVGDPRAPSTPGEERPFRGARPITALLAFATLALIACVAHAAFSGRAHSQARLGPALDLAARASLDAPALAAPEDLRHPGWARAEMPLGGQPTLVDPRAAALVVRPPPMRVER